MQSSYVKWLRWGVIGGLFLTLLIPFIVANGSHFPNMFFPFITGKNFVFRILVEILFGIWLLLALREPRYRPRFSWVLVSVLAFTVWVGIALLFGSVDMTKSFWSNFERSEGYITVLHLFLYFIVASSVLTAERLWMWFFRGSLAMSVLMSVYGILQLVGRIPIDQGGVRLDGTLGNADYMAVYMLFNVFFGLFLLCRDWRNVGLRWLYGAITLLDIVMLFYTETRGTILGLIGGLIVMALGFLIATRHDLRFRILRRTSWGILGVLVILILAFIPLRHQAWVAKTPGLDRLASISLSNSETTARLKIWNMALDGFKERPVFGWGQDNFNFVFNKFYDPTMYSQEQWFDRAHDAYLDWLSNSGVLGFLLFISLFASAAWALWRAQGLSAPERAVLMGLLAGYAFHEIFVFDNLVSYLQFFAVIALAHGLSQREMPGRVWLARPLGEQGMAVAAPIVAVLAIGGAWVINAPGIANAENLVAAISTQTPSGASVDLSQNLADFKNILNNGPLGKQETTEQLLQFAMAVAQAPQASPQIKQEFYTTALNAVDEMTKERPNDARLELFYGTFLDAFGQYPDAKTQLQKALAASPDKQQIMFELAQNEMNSGDTQGALATLQKAYTLDTNYDDARVQYAAALYAAGQNDKADALLTERFGTTSPDNSTLLQALYTAKQYPRAEAILKGRLAKTPTDTQSWVQLAAVYYIAGDKADAVATLHKAVAANPDFASQADQLIQQIQQAQ